MPLALFALSAAAVSVLCLCCGGSPFGSYSSLGSCCHLEEGKSKDGWQKLENSISFIPPESQHRTGDIITFKPVLTTKPLLQAALYPPTDYGGAERTLSAETG